jgi:heptosyltransferase-2
MKKDIWVFQSSFVGDCVLSLPFLKELLKVEPEARVRLVTQKGIQQELFLLALDRGLKEHASRVEVLPFDKKAQKTLWSLFIWMRSHRRSVHDSRDVEVAFCLHRSFRSALLAFLSGARYRLGFSSGAASFLYTQAVPRTWDRGEHEIEKNLNLLRAYYPAQTIPTYLGKDIQKCPSILASAEKRPARMRDRVALALGSPWPTKRWPIEHAIELCEKWMYEGIEVYLLGDASAKDLAAQIESAVPSLLIRNHVGQTNMKEWVDLLDSCSLLVSGDSASVHVASDLGVPVLGLFGPTVPDFGFAPWRAHSKVLQLADLPCRPCHIHGPKTCPLGHHKCLKDLEPKHVFRHSKSYLLMDPSVKKL